MDLTNSIIQFSTAEQMARVQAEVATRVLKLANDQGDVAAKLVGDAMENVQESIGAMAEGLDPGFDAYA